MRSVEDVTLNRFVSLVLTFIAASLPLLAVTGAFADPGRAAIIRTIAGTGRETDSGRSGTATAVNIGQPFGVEIAPSGDLYVTEVQHHRVWKINRSTADAQVIAGNGQKGYSGDGGLAVEAAMNEPYEVRFDAAGNLFVVEMRNHIVRRVDSVTGIITTVAGTGSPGFSGDGGPAAAAELRVPHGIAFDSAGILYIADIGNHRIRTVNLSTGQIETLTGNGETRLPSDGDDIGGRPLPGPRAMAVAGDSLWVVLREGHSLWRIDLKTKKIHRVAGTGSAGYGGDGGPGAAVTFNGPKGLAVDQSGNLFIVDSENDAIRRMDVSSGIITTVAGHGRTRSYSGDGGLPTVASFSQPHGICIAADGTVIVADTLNHRVREF